jgi:primosomal protein N' (replication factor Y) (superfamily II helicase)
VPRPKPKDTTNRLWFEEGEHASAPVATVALIGPFDQTYTYRIPDALHHKLAPGMRVEVPVGKQARIVPGFIIALDEQPWDSTLREITSAIDTESTLDDELLELGHWIARHYVCPLGKALKALVPEAARKQSGFQKINRLRLAKTIDQIEQQTQRIGPKQKAVLRELADTDSPINQDRVIERTGCSSATIRTMQQRGWIDVQTIALPKPAPDFDVPRNEPGFDLNDAQQDALSNIQHAIDLAEFRVTLLFGVSGSGKTEIYIRSIRRVLKRGQQAILLLPEIALTTQQVNRLACRFTDVALVHSGLTGVERSLTWQAIRKGQKTVIIGTRSAVFAPCPNLGMIVVDEEQETSYKNLQAPRFHLRDVAIKRGQMLKIPILLGSATPSLESWNNCATVEHFHRVDLPRRVRSLPLPQVTLIDMRNEYSEKTGTPMLSRIMIRRLDETFAKNEQAIILLNRRGYANWLHCNTCKHRLTCPDCNVNLVYHKGRNDARCHYCAHRIDNPQQCPDPSCTGRLVRGGLGTQRVEERLTRLFPDQRIERVDSDTMQNRPAYESLIHRLEQRDIDCVIGTQMIAKGLDFPFVSFVGMIGADATADGTDFRASERLFQLVTQVAGRAGRGHLPGNVVVQTQSPDSVAVQKAAHHDFVGFADSELDIRRKTAMPPFSRLTRIVIADQNEPKTRQKATELAQTLREIVAKQAINNARILGPNPAARARLRGKYRFELLLTCPTPANMQKWLDSAKNHKLLYGCLIDVDPVDLS